MPGAALRDAGAPVRSPGNGRDAGEPAWIGGVAAARRSCSLGYCGNGRCSVTVKGFVQKGHFEFLSARFIDVV